jgi:hypothetical protein
MEDWQNYREWFQKNEYKEIRSVFITFKFILFFPVLSHFGKVLIFFPTKKKKNGISRMTCEKNDIE